MGSTSQTEIRQLGTGDWQLLRQLRLAALAQDPHAFLSLEGNETRFDPDQWRQRLDPDVGVWFAALIGDQACGVIRLVRNPESGERYAESMWVDREFRQQGIATGLLGAAESFVQDEGGAVLNLWVLDGNEQSLDFYRRRGFARTDHCQRIQGRSEERLRIELPSPARLAAAGTATPGCGES